jgi:DNA-binding transcriptional LysR family regulator
MLESVAAFSVFVQVAELRSFVAAGRAMGVSASAIGKRISRLEERLGVQLFQRSTRSISLTPEGEKLLERSRRILDEIEEIQTELSSAADLPQGKLKISLAPISDVFLDHLARFNERYPQIELELDYAERNVDIIQEGFDAAIRVGDGADSNLRAHHMGDFRRLIVASPAYLLRHGVPARPQQLLEHKLLHYRSPNSGKVEPWPLNNCGELHLPTSMICNDINTRIDFALKGLGIACLPDISIRKPLRDGLLTPMLLDHTANSTKIHALWPHAHQHTSRQKAFIDFIKSVDF